MKKAAGKAPAKVVKLTEKDKDRLRGAISAGHLQNVSKCLARGFEPYWSTEMLQLALNRGFEKIFTMLVEQGARVQDVAAAVFDNALVSRYFDPPGSPPSQLWKAELILRYLTRDTVRNSFLVPALRHAPIVTALLRIGADPNWDYDRGSVRGESILAYAIENGHSASAIALLEGGADARWETSFRQTWHYRVPPTLRKPVKETLLHRAVHNSKISIDVLRLLLRKGADPTVSVEYSPLRFAISERRGDMVECLLQHGAPTDGMLDYAFSIARWDAVWLLVRHGTVPTGLLLGFSSSPPLPLVGTLLRLGARFYDEELMRWMAAGGVQVSTSQEARAAARLMAPQLLQRIP